MTNEYMKPKFIDIGTLKVKVEPHKIGSRLDGIDVQTTHNGHQWSSINLSNEQELRIVYQTIGRYLKEEE